MKKLVFISLFLCLGCFRAYHTGRDIVGVEDAFAPYRPNFCPRCWINFSNQEAWDIVFFPISIPMIPPSFLGGVIIGGVGQIFRKKPGHVWDIPPEGFQSPSKSPPEGFQSPSEDSKSPPEGFQSPDPKN